MVRLSFLGHFWFSCKCMQAAHGLFWGISLATRSALHHTWQNFLCPFKRLKSLAFFCLMSLKESFESKSL